MSRGTRRGADRYVVVETRRDIDDVLLHPGLGKQQSVGRSFMSQGSPLFTNTQEDQKLKSFVGRNISGRQ